MKRFIVFFCRMLCVACMVYVGVVMDMLMGSTRPVIHYAANVGTVLLGGLVGVVFLCTFIPVKYTGSNAQRTPAPRTVAPQNNAPCDGCGFPAYMNRCVTHSVNLCSKCSIQHMGVGCQIQPLATYKATIDRLEGSARDASK